MISSNDHHHTTIGWYFYLGSVEARGTHMIGRSLNLDQAQPYNDILMAQENHFYLFIYYLKINLIEESCISNQQTAT